MHSDSSHLKTKYLEFQKIFKMLTIKDKSDIGAVINWAYKWCSCPFTWDGEKGIFRYTNSPSKEIGLFYNALYWWGYLAFLSSALIQGKEVVAIRLRKLIKFGVILANFIQMLTPERLTSATPYVSSSSLLVFPLG